MRILMAAISCCMAFWSAIVLGQSPTAKGATALMNQYSLAEQAFQHGDLATAQTLFEAIVRQVNDQPLAQLRLGLIYQKQHRFRQAMIAYDEVLLLPPGDQPDDQVRSAQMKARFNRAVLSLQAAAEDLEHIEPGSLDASTDKGRVALQRYVQAALAEVGERSNAARYEATDPGAKGVVLMREPPVKPAIVPVSTEGQTSSAASKVRLPMSPVVIRGGVTDTSTQRPDQRTSTQH